MANQIAHVVYGKRIFDRINHEDLVWSEFVVATLFPDIRELAGLDRNSVHTYPTSEEKIPSDDSFKSGFYVHSFVDDKRAKILDELGAYKTFPFEYFYDTALKIREDQLFYDKFDWNEPIGYLKKIYDQEVDIVKNRDIVKRWHGFLQKYFSKKPDWQIWKEILRQANMDKKNIFKHKDMVDWVQSDDQFDKILYQLKEKI